MRFFNLLFYMNYSKHIAKSVRGRENGMAKGRTDYFKRHGNCIYVFLPGFSLFKRACS
jgi:hypothetical protein